MIYFGAVNFGIKSSQQTDMQTVSKAQVTKSKYCMVKIFSDEYQKMTGAVSHLFCMDQGVKLRS